VYAVPPKLRVLVAIGCRNFTEEPLERVVPLTAHDSIRRCGLWSGASAWNQGLALSMSKRIDEQGVFLGETKRTLFGFVIHLVEMLAQITNPRLNRRIIFILADGSRPNIFLVFLFPLYSLSDSLQ